MRNNFIAAAIQVIDTWKLANKENTEHYVKACQYLRDLTESYDHLNKRASNARESSQILRGYTQWLVENSGLSLKETLSAEHCCAGGGGESKEDRRCENNEGDPSRSDTDEQVFRPR